MSELYELPPEDVEYLQARFSSKWRKVSEGPGKHGLIIEDFNLPHGYTKPESNLMILVPVGYPGSALDMFYFSPHLKKSDGTGISALADESHFGQTWQRWSRHYKDSAWQPGVDTLITHIEFIQNETLKEVPK
ncbi:MAG: hypothetical protein F4039_05420 [Gammaproteobacteria bacterium]|nr:hypothetical protein [Gammaproteobacteria bacterium]MYF52689.1 hypothetical protein [Gammaproteobacteria bacterium]MYK43506.1 hypothetical protein [Gammaproteobacteria bacterium]